MTGHASLKRDILTACAKKMKEGKDFIDMPIFRQRHVAAPLIEKGYTLDDVSAILFRQVLDSANVSSIVGNAKIVVFSSEQAEIFSGIAGEYDDSLDYRLPFKDVLLTFDRPIMSKVALAIQASSGNERETSSVVAFALRQVEMTKEEFDKESHLVAAAAAHILPECRDVRLQTIDGAGTFLQNIVSIVFDSMHIVKFAWQSETTRETFLNYTSGMGHETLKGEYADQMIWVKNLVTACIGYINCENVYLEKQGEVPEAVNRKREAKGKSRLEPFYVCRIKGVQYNSDGTETGSKHGVRYDVRGHFRRLQSGKTLWVRPHQRGLANELYMPKVYKVDKGSKPEWEAQHRQLATKPTA